VILRARFLVPYASCEIENGAVAVERGRIVAAGRADEVMRRCNGKVVDFGDAAILPGLVNAHTHLELTDLHGRVPPSEKFTDWLAAVMRERLFWTRWRFRRSIRRGVGLSLEGGTTTVGEISNTRNSFKVMKRGSLRSVVFYEAICFHPRGTPRKVRKIRRRLRRYRPTRLMSVGISPHAPYSACLELYGECKRVADEMGLVLCTHLHETPAEIEFVKHGTGEFADLLRRLRIIPEDRQPAGVSPIQLLNREGLITGDTLLVHCNYLDEDDLAVLEEKKPHVAFCPRSHAFFGHDSHPFKKLRELGVNVCIGTDSLASNDTLSMLDEMRFLVDRLSVPPEDALDLCTRAGAEALGLSDVAGRLEPGLEADMAVLSVPSGCRSAREGVLDGSSRNLCTIVAGEAAFAAPESPLRPRRWWKPSWNRPRPRGGAPDEAPPR